MNNIKLITIGVVILLIGGVGAFFILSDSDDRAAEKEYVQYDSSKGWASWDPIVSKVSSSHLGGSPFTVDTVEELYKEIYGNLPSYNRFTINDVPSDFYNFDSLISYNNDGKLVVKSYANDSNGKLTSRDVVFKDTADYNMSPGSYVATLYYIMAYAAGKDPMAYDAAVVSDMWTKVNAATFSTYQDLEINFGIPIDGFNGFKMPQLSASDIYGSREEYVKVFNDVAKEGKSTVYIGYASMNSWDSGGGKWLTDLAESQGSYVILGGFNTVNDILALVEMMSHIYGMKDVAQDIVDDMRLKLYTLSVASEEKMKGLPYQLCGVCTYANSDWTFGPNSIADEMFKILSVRNIMTGASGNWDQENVIVEQPEIVLLTGSQSTLNTIDMDIALRVRK